MTRGGSLVDPGGEDQFNLTDGDVGGVGHGGDVTEFVGIVAERGHDLLRSQFEREAKASIFRYELSDAVNAGGNCQLLLRQIDHFGTEPFRPDALGADATARVDSSSVTGVGETAASISKRRAMIVANIP